MDCFQKLPEYILSEQWKTWRLSSFVCLCSPVCHKLSFSTDVLSHSSCFVFFFSFTHLSNASFIPVNCLLVLFQPNLLLIAHYNARIFTSFVVAAVVDVNIKTYCFERQPLFWKRWVEFFWIKMRCDGATGRCGKGEIYLKEVVTSCIWLPLGVTVCRKQRRGCAVLKIRLSVC